MATFARRASRMKSTSTTTQTTAPIAAAKASPMVVAGIGSATLGTAIAAFAPAVASGANR